MLFAKKIRLALLILGGKHDDVILQHEAPERHLADTGRLRAALAPRPDKAARLLPRVSVGPAQMGHMVVDTLTGFRGTMVGYCQYMTGCNQVLVHPGIREDGSLHETQWIDAQRFTVDGEQGVYVLDNGNTPGADAPPPAARR